MGIQVEFNPDLALRDFKQFKAGKRKKEECLPERLQVGKTYPFLKQGLRNYWLEGEIPLLETEGEGRLSRPLASVVILEATHFLAAGRPFTKGRYLVKQVFDPSKPQVHFDSYQRLK